jgi:hypothetical protein
MAAAKIARLHALGASALTVAVAFAQNEPPPAATTVEPLLRIEVSGPAVFRERLLPTNLGSMVASAEGEAIWKDAVAAIEAGWRQLHGDDPTFLAARRRLLDYSGRVHLWGWCGTEAAQARTDIDAVTAIVDADGKTDLRALARDLRLLLEHATGKSGQTAVDGGNETWRLADGDHQALAVDCRADGRLLFAFGDTPVSIAKAMAQTAAQLPPTPKKPGQEPLLDCRLDLAQIVRLNARGQQAVAIAAALGCGSLRTLEFTLQPRGPQLQCEFGLACAGDRGLFAGLFPEQPGTPDLLGLVPATAIGSKTSRCDPGQIWRVLLGALVVGEKKTVAEVEAEIEKEAGVDVGKDVLPHLNGEVMLVWEAPGDEEGAEPRFSLVARLKDGKAFTAGFAKLLDKGGLHPVSDNGVLRAGEDSSWFIPAMHFGVTDKYAIVAFGKAGDERVEALLALAKTPRAVDEAIAQQRRAEPPGCNGAGVLDVGICLRYHVGVLLEMLHEFAGRLAPDVELSARARWLEAATPLLQKHHLDRIVVFTGTEKGRWAFRMLW